MSQYSRADPVSGEGITLTSLWGEETHQSFSLPKVQTGNQETGRTQAKIVGEDSYEGRD